jgi:hypothetical protein
MPRRVVARVRGLVRARSGLVAFTTFDGNASAVASPAHARHLSLGAHRRGATAHDEPWIADDESACATCTRFAAARRSAARSVAGRPRLAAAASAPGTCTARRRTANGRCTGAASTRTTAAAFPRAGAGVPTAPARSAVRARAGCAGCAGRGVVRRLALTAASPSERRGRIRQDQDSSEHSHPAHSWRTARAPQALAPRSERKPLSGVTSARLPQSGRHGNWAER